MSTKNNILLELGVCWSGGPKKTRTYGVALCAHPGIIIPLCEGMATRAEAKAVLKRFMADFDNAYSIKSIEEAIINPLLRDLNPMLYRMDWIKKEKSS